MQNPQDQTMKLVESSGCPALDCPESHQITLSHSCCKVCKDGVFTSERVSYWTTISKCSLRAEHEMKYALSQGMIFEQKIQTTRRHLEKLHDCSHCYDFCSERHNCMENSVCRNLNDRAVCSCRDGFRALREDNAYCEGNPCNDV
ncbi:hypothetical protein P7K49_019367 [Saguinus oedipus]|uniref:Uncharacterized protein n=1 Tax=Saguinus oedipus TaxID=9490 RepID=A0ABQ9UXG4_SAGOE|nr:hypothetical protein P7K49_019367 [Saguinus oedipus]